MALLSDNYALIAVRPLVVRVATVVITFLFLFHVVSLCCLTSTMIKLINIRYMYLRLEKQDALRKGTIYTNNEECERFTHHIVGTSTTRGEWNQDPSSLID